MRSKHLALTSKHLLFLTLTSSSEPSVPRDDNILCGFREALLQNNSYNCSSHNLLLCKECLADNPIIGKRGGAEAKNKDMCGSSLKMCGKSNFYRFLCENGDLSRFFQWSLSLLLTKISSRFINLYQKWKLN